MRKMNQKKFGQDIRGGVVIIFALAIVPMLLLTGLAVDYSRAANETVRIQGALDAATLAYARNYHQTRDPDAASVIGTEVFDRNCETSRCSPHATATFSVEDETTINGTAQSNIEALFGELAGVQQLKSQVRSQVAIGAGKHKEFHFALDFSASLGIAADQVNRRRLEDLTKPYLRGFASMDSPDGCAFACHEREGWEPAGKTSFDMAREAGIKLREDVLMEATHRALDIILEKVTGTHADQINVGAYVFSDTLDVVTKPTANAQNIKTKLGNASLRRWNTAYDVALPELKRIIGRQGSGATKKDPEKTLVLITDGVHDVFMSMTQRAIDVAHCTAIKQNGIRVVVVNVEYVNLAGDILFERMVRPFYSELSRNLKQCASPGYYYTANDTPQIQATLLKMAKHLVGDTVVRLAK